MELTLKSYRKIIDSIPDGLYIVDATRKIIYWNRAAEQISGFTREEMLNHSCSDNTLCHVDEAGSTLCSGDCPFSIGLTRGRYATDVFLRHKDGHRVPISVQVTTLEDGEGRITGEVMIFNDMSSKTANETRLKELETLALLDRLTRIANRHYLERELEARLEEKIRYDVPFGVMFMDIDDFKVVNDRYGHETGDRVLQYVARTLSANSRPFDLYGRWGGEEFVGIARNVTAADLKHMAQRLRRLVERSFLVINDKRLQVTISMGATLATDSDSIATLIHRADALMYHSKRAGKNRVTME